MKDYASNKYHASRALRYAYHDNEAARDWRIQMRGITMPLATAGAPPQKRSSYWVPMLGHAFKVLEVFYEAGVELGLQEINIRAGVSKTSALRILYTLGELGYIDRNKATGKYQLGIKIMEVARRATAGRNVVQIARPYMQQLRLTFDETVNLAVLRNSEIIYVEIIESGQPFRMVTEVGSRVPMHATALGKAIAAFLPDSEVRAILQRSEMTHFTPRTICTIDRFERAIHKLRSRSYAIDNEENEKGAYCIASPILSQKGHAIGAISVAGPIHRVKLMQRPIAKQLHNACAAITRAIQIAGIQ